MWQRLRLLCCDRPTSNVGPLALHNSQMNCGCRRGRVSRCSVGVNETDQETRIKCIEYTSEIFPMFGFHLYWFWSDEGQDPSSCQLGHRQRERNTGHRLFFDGWAKSVEQQLMRTTFLFPLSGAFLGSGQVVT